jgi:Allene oxide cyclase
MHPSLRLVVPVALAAPLLVYGLPAGPAAADEIESLTVVERATSDAVTDTGAEGDSVGDILTFANEIYDQANATLLGHDNGWCVRTVVGAAWECFWTLTLKDGQITVEGPFYDGRDSMLAVTGGTGTYAGARGEMKLHARDAAGSAYDFVYSLRR